MITLPLESDEPRQVRSCEGCACQITSRYRICEECLQWLCAAIRVAMSEDRREWWLHVGEYHQ